MLGKIILLNKKGENFQRNKNFYGQLFVKAVEWGFST